MAGENETEVKIRIEGADATLKRLRETGFSVSEPRQFEANTLYDTPDSELMRKKMLLRLRQAGERQVITWKGPGVAGPHKSRPEIETHVESIERLGRILEQLGYRRSFRYEKFRTELRSGDGDDGVVTVDETPIGNFLELEGQGEWIDTTAGKLGFSAKDYVLESYGRLYLADCERRGVQPFDMVFASQAQRS